MTAKEQFEKLVIDAPKDGIGNAKGMMDYVTSLMEQAHDIGKSESEATIENLASRVIELEAALQNIADATDGENPADAVFYFAAINALKQTP